MVLTFGEPTLSITTHGYMVWAMIAIEQESLALSAVNEARAAARTGDYGNTIDREVARRNACGLGRGRVDRGLLE
jgi:hypothetical protein